MAPYFIKGERLQVLKIKDKTYNLKFTTQSFIHLEEVIGKNPLTVFMRAADGELPKLSELMIILHQALIPLNHGIEIEDVFKMYDDYRQEGGDLVTLIELLVRTLQDSGFLPKKKKIKN